MICLSNISAGTGFVLIRSRSECIRSDAAFRMLVRKIFSPFGSVLKSVFCSICPLTPYDIAPSFPSLR